MSATKKECVSGKTYAKQNRAKKLAQPPLTNKKNKATFCRRWIKIGSRIKSSVGEVQARDEGQESLAVNVSKPCDVLYCLGFEALSLQKNSAIKVVKLFTEKSIALFFKTC